MVSLDAAHDRIEQLETEVTMLRAERNDLREEVAQLRQQVRHHISTICAAVMFGGM